MDSFTFWIQRTTDSFLCSTLMLSEQLERNQTNRKLWVPYSHGRTTLLQPIDNFNKIKFNFYPNKPSCLIYKPSFHEGVMFLSELSEI